ncbi:MAG: caspase family protein [Bacteroidales bacterium]|nr:caspase family protein [Bacteroidales bacterium]
MIRCSIIVLISCFCVFAYGGDKRALIVAIGSYPANSGWNKLSSANDAKLMRTILQQQGFEDKNIAILADERATKANILKSLENLITKSNKSDVVVFHFSGHGQQIVDKNGDELDEYDEALIPLDARKTETTQYKGTKHLIDDELNGFLYRLRQKVGPKGDVIFILDACHSGTATRGTEDEAIFRGTDVPFEIAKPESNKYSEESDKFDEQQSQLTRGNAELSPFVIISASGQQELNLEIKDKNNTGYGSLTFALGKVLANNHEKLTYISLFDLTRNEMCAGFEGKHQQTPQLEGQADRILFAGSQVIIPTHCRVISVVNSTKLMVDAGELNGLTIGSEISFYPINTNKPDKAGLLAKGIVKRVGLTESDVSFDKAIEKEKFKDTWGFVTKYQLSKMYPDVNTMRADVLRRATSREPSLDVSFEMINSKTSLAIPVSHPFKIGDSFQIKIINKGSKDAFFQIIDIQPDNQISLLFDASQLSNNDLYIKAGQAKIIDKVTFTISNPVGVEMLKLVASDKQLDLSAIKTKLPVANRSSQANEFEQFLDEIYGTEQGERSLGSFSKVNIYTRTFTIKAK